MSTAVVLPRIIDDPNLRHLTVGMRGALYDLYQMVDGEGKLRILPNRLFDDYAVAWWGNGGVDILLALKEANQVEVKDGVLSLVRWPVVP